MASRHHKWWLPWKGGVLRPSTPSSIICLSRLRIASNYIFNLWQLRQGVDSLAQWLEHWIFIREDRVRFPRKAWIFFSYALFLCCDFHVVRLFCDAFKAKGYAFRGGNCHFFFHSEKVSSLKGKNLLRVDPFSEEDWCASKQTESNKTCLPGKNIVIHQVYQVPFISTELYWVYSWGSLKILQHLSQNLGNALLK